MTDRRPRVSRYWLRAGLAFAVLCVVGALSAVPRSHVAQDRVAGNPFHSDRSGDLCELTLQGWVAGRGEPLRVHGPPGVDTDSNRCPGRLPGRCVV